LSLSLKKKPKHDFQCIFDQLKRQVCILSVLPRYRVARLLIEYWSMSVAGCKNKQYLFDRFLMFAKISLKHRRDKKVEINWIVQASGKKMGNGEVQKLCHNSRPKI